MKTKKLLVISLALGSLVLSACAKVQVKNKEWCSVAGVLGAGADCAETLTTKTREMDVTEFIQWLEPTSERGPAICMSSEDALETKNEIEQACAILKNKCTAEEKAAIRRVSKRLEEMRRASIQEYNLHFHP